LFHGTVLSLGILSTISTLSIACSDEAPGLLKPAPGHSDADVAFYSERDGNVEIYTM